MLGHVGTCSHQCQRNMCVAGHFMQGETLMQSRMALARFELFLLMMQAVNDDLNIDDAKEPSETMSPALLSRIRDMAAAR